MSFQIIKDITKIANLLGKKIKIRYRRRDLKINACYGVYLIYPRGAKQAVKDAIIPGFVDHGKPVPYPLVDFQMPCGESVCYLSVGDLPDEDVPCPCGDPAHWFVKYKESSNARN